MINLEESKHIIKVAHVITNSIGAVVPVVKFFVVNWFSAKLSFSPSSHLRCSERILLSNKHCMWHLNVSEVETWRFTSAILLIVLPPSVVELFEAVENISLSIVHKLLS